MKIIQIAKKDIKILIRSRFSALIILLGPLFLVLLVGLAFNTSSVSNIKIYTYSISYSELSENLLNALKDQQFSLTKVNSEKDCIDSIKTGNSHVCMIIPADLKIESNKSNEIEFYVDNSRINLVYLVINEVSKKVSVQSKELGKGLAQGLLDVINNAEIKLLDSKDKITSIRSGNSKIGSESSNIADNINSFSLSINASELRVQDIKSGNLSCGNCSSEYKSVVDSIVTKLESIESDSSKINSAKDAIQKSIGSIKSENDKSSDFIDDISTSLNDILTSVNGIKVKEAESIVTPIKTIVKPISSSTSNLNFLFPTLVALVIMFVSILLSSTIVIREKKTRAYFRNFITPTNNFTFIIGTFLTCLFILVIQLSIIFGQGIFIQKSLLISSSLFGLLLVLFIIAMLFIFVGMFIGYVFNSEETVILAAMSTSTLFLFISNAILPIETIPPELKWLALFNPFVVADSVLKKMLLFNSSLGLILTELYLLLAYVILLVSLIYLARVINKRKIA